MKTTETTEEEKPFNQIVQTGGEPVNAKAGSPPPAGGALGQRALPPLGPCMMAPDRITVRAQARKIFDAAKQKELEASIAEQGIVQRLVVRRLPDGTLDLVCGARRWRAALVLKLDLVPVEVREMTEKEALGAQLVENGQREGLTALEEGEAYRDAIQVRKLFTVEDLMEQIGKSRSHVYGRMALAGLCPKIKAALEAGEIDASVAGLLATVPDPKQQDEALKYTRENNWNGERPSFRDVQQRLERCYRRDLKGVCFDLADKRLDAQAGSCADCPKRAGNLPGFAEAGGKNPNYCTDPACLAGKEEAWLLRAKEAGKMVLTAPEFAKKKDQLVDLEEHHRELPWNRKECRYASYGQILGKHAPEPMLAIVDGEVRKFAVKTEVRKIIAEKKLMPAPRPMLAIVDGSKQDLAERRAAAKLGAAREKLAPAIIQRLVQAVELKAQKHLQGFVRMFTALFIGADLDYDAGKRVKARGWKDKDIAGKFDWELAGLLMEMLLFVNDGDGAVDYNGDWSRELRFAAEWAGLDLKAVEKELAPPEEPSPELPAKKRSTGNKGKVLSAATRVKISQAQLKRSVTGKKKGK